MPGLAAGRADARTAFDGAERAAGLDSAIERVLDPGDVAGRDVEHVDVALLGQAAREADCHLRVVGDLTCFEVKRSTADDIGRRAGREGGVRGLFHACKLVRGAERVTDRHAEQRANTWNIDPILDGSVAHSVKSTPPL